MPRDKPKKWDAADAVAEGFDGEALLAASTRVNSKPSQPFDITQWRAAERFTGEPKPRRWLVEGVFPLAQAALVAAGGGVGKSFLLLALSREVSAFDGSWLNAPILFGGALTGHGGAIYVTAEDDAIEVHNRLNALGPIPERLYVLPLPDAGGAVALFAPGPATRGRSVTTAWAALEQQLKSMAGLILVVLDPLQLLCALDLNVPENAQFVCSRLAALAASTGASVIVSHHFAKRDSRSPPFCVTRGACWWIEAANWCAPISPTQTCTPHSRPPLPVPPSRGGPTPRPVATAFMSDGTNYRKPSTPLASVGWPSGWAHCSTARNW